MAKVKLTQDKAKNSPAGGVVVGKRNGQTMIYDDASVGGYFVGKTHKEGGIQMINKSNGQPLEVQGSEVIITAPAVADQTKNEFNGKMMTNREILSQINVNGGGVAFADGGDIPKKIKRTGASYKYGGKTMTDHEIYKYITGGGIAEDFSIRDIANIHQVPLAELKEEVRIGMIAESEHKTDKKDQMEIVKDHLLENPKYYTLLKKAGLVEEKTAPLEKSEWLKQFYVTNNPSIDKLLKDLQPKIKELIEKQKELVIKESTRIFGEPRPMSELDIEFYEAGLLLKMVQSFNKYLKNSDELYDVTINKSGGLFEVNGKVKREGRTYRFDTELIGAGGYNIQEYHYRYIIKTDLPSSNENSAVENIKAKMGILRKIKTVDEDIARYEKSISSYEKQIKDGGYQLKSGEFYKLSERYVESYKSSILDYRKEIQKFENKKSDLISVFESLDKKGVGVNFGKQVKEAIGRRILVDRLHGSKYKETGDTLDFKIDSRSIKGKELGNREFESLGTINTFSFVDEGNGLCTMKAGLELRGKYTPYAEYKNLPIKEIPYKINEIFNGEFSRYLEYEDGGEVQKALNDLQKAPSVSFWYEPEFNGETYFFEKEGEPNSFVSLQEDDISKTILAYDEDGKLVGAFKIRTWGDLKGAFKIVVREDAKNKGWGKKLLDEAEKQNIDIVNNVKNNSFSSSGRDLLRSWLNKKSKQYKNGGLESGGKILNQNSKNRVLSDDYKNKMATSTAKKDIRTFYNKVNDFDDRKDSEHWRKYALPYDTKFDIEFKKGGAVHRGSLVRDAKSGNTPARDLNNYNDVLDLEADGMVGADSGLYADGGLIAPNGNKSNLTPKQYKLVRTPEFKAWFGDWENDPENASKVVDENGEPLVVYHKTDNKFTIFDKEKLGSKSQWGTAYFGFYFSNKYEKISYGKKVIKCFLSIKNPYHIESETYSDYDYDYKKFDINNFSKNDGIEIKTKRLVFDEKADKHFVAFEPNQIKLADGTNTTFDSSNPDIRYADGGMFNTEPFLNYYFDEIAEFLKYQNNITLNKDFTFKYKGELFRVEPIVLSEKNIKEAYFSIIDSDNEEVGDIVFNPNNNKKFEANSDFFDWNNIKFYDGGNVKPYDANTEGDSADIMFAEGGILNQENFKQWFNGSKVVDKKGNPLVVYHGSPDLRGLKSDYIFKTSNERFGISNENRAYFFTDSYSIAKSYADPHRAFDYQNAEEGVMQLYLSLKNPLIVDANNQIWRKFETEINGEKIVGTRNLISYAQSKNYDGVIVKNVRDYYTNNENKKNGGNVYVAFEPEQIKLADGTNTKFDNMNPDIRYATGGDVKPYDANMEGDSADMIFAEGGAVSSVVNNWDEVPSIWKNTSKVKKVAWTNSPYDKGLYSIVSPFLGNDDLRPIMSGINFDENGITVTDAHKMICLPYPSKEFEGIYEADLSKRVNPEQITISGKYPNYAPIIPESKNTVKYEVDVYKLLQYTNVAIKYANKTTYAVNYKIYDEIIGFNANYLNQVLTTLLKLGHDKVYGHFVGYTKAFIFSPQKDYELGNDDILLIMPLVTDKKFYGAEDILYGSNRKLSVYYDFNDNEIHNADGSIAEFKMTYENNSVISKEDVTLLEKLANGKNKLRILDYVLIENGIARASDLDSEYYLSGVPLPDGIYKPNKGALEITMEAMDDYPLSPIFVTDEDTIQFVISSGVLEYYVDKFQNVVGKDDLRPVMQGICLHHTSDNKLFLAGTDANILLKVNITEYVDMPVYNKDMKFIIEPKRLYDFLNSTENTALTIKSNLVATSIQSDNWSFYARNIDGNYPNYEAVIPRETSKFVSVGIDPIKKAFNTETVKNYVKEAYSKDKVFIFNKENEIFIATGTNGENIEILCETNVDFRLDDYYNDNKNVLLIMPFGYNKQNNFAFRKDLLERVFKIVNDNKLDLHYNELNRAYLIPIDSFDFKATTKEFKVREQKPSVAEVKLVSTINEVSEIKEAIETLEMLSETATRKDKKEIKEAIEVLQMLLDTYEY